jgi:hypothetical protein
MNLLLIVAIATLFELIIAQTCPFPLDATNSIELIAINSITKGFGFSSNFNENMRLVEFSISSQYQIVGGVDRFINGSFVDNILNFSVAANSCTNSGLDLKNRTIWTEHYS